MTACTILQFPIPVQETDATEEQEPTAQENLRGIWLSLRYLEEEALRLGESELAFLIGMAGMTARDLTQAGNHQG